MPSARSSVEPPDGAGRPLHEPALGDLEGERRGRQARLVEDRPDRCDEVVLLELAGGQVDADLEVGELEPELPFARLAARLAEDPATHRHDVAGLLGQIDELHRHEQRPIRELPADERFEPDDGPGRELDDRLVVEAQLAALVDAAEEGSEVAPRRRLRPERGTEELGPAARRGLRGVHRDVGVAEEVVGRLAVGAAERDADAGGDHRRRVAQVERLAEGVGQADGDRQGAFLVPDVVEEDGELVAAEAGRGVARPERGGDPHRRGRDEDVVAARVAEGVVEDLEVVEVDEQDAERPAATAAAPLEGLDDPIAEEDAIGQAGQAVVQRLVADLVVETGVLEGHRGLAREHRRDLDVAGVERAAPRRRQLERPDRRARRR